jgi:hypothetical protein
MKRDIVNTTEVVTIETIENKYNELRELVDLYTQQFTKKTIGLQSVGEVGIDFTEKCFAKAQLFPEILPGTFDITDFQLKAGGLKDIQGMVFKLVVLVNKLDAPLKICKTDAKFYSNKFYSLIQEESNNSAKYLPTLSELTAFYKRSKSDKNDSNKPANPVEN